MAEIQEDATECVTLCPSCKNPLYSAPVSRGRYVVWCPRGDCKQLANGPNEGGYGTTPEKALKVLMAKLGISKDYEVESTESPVESDSSSKSEKAPKKTGGKRGRKAKNENVTFIVPVGQFTMKEFCEKNETYPYKAIPFFKEKNIEEVGFRKTASGRGKSAVLYQAKI